MSKMFITADTHFGHDKIIEYCNRPFNNAGEMDEYLLDQINSTVGRSDHLIINGDYCFHGRESFYRQKIRCKHIVYVLGNHCHVAKVKKVFSDVREIYQLRHPMAVISHFPMLVWNKKHYGAIHLYGHCHSQAEENFDRLLPGRRSMDVGVDNAKKLLGDYKPFSLEYCYDLLKDRPGYNLDISDKKDNRNE